MKWEGKNDLSKFSCRDFPFSPNGLLGVNMSIAYMIGYAAGTIKVLFDKGQLLIAIVIFSMLWSVIWYTLKGLVRKSRESDLYMKVKRTASK